MPLKDIRGQQKAIEILKKGLEQGRLPNAYLFLGPKGSGKFRTALEFSKLLNCENKGDDCCNTCSSCIRIEKFMHPDIFVVSKDDDAARISIKKIKEVGGRLSLKAFEAKYKIAIIVNAEDMSEEASNSLLKMLEEPTADTLFILTASNQRALPDTVISRCQAVRFRPLTRDEVNKILTGDFSMEEKEAKFLSAISDANVEKALALKEKDAITRKNNIIDEFSLYKNRLGQDSSTILDDKRDMQLYAMNILLGFYCDVLVYKFTNDEDLIINIDRMDTIADFARRMDTEQIQKVIESIDEAKQLLESNCNAKLTIKTLQEKLASL